MASGKLVPHLRGCEKGHLRGTGWAHTPFTMHHEPLPPKNGVDGEATLTGVWVKAAQGRGSWAMAGGGVVQGSRCGAAQHPSHEGKGAPVRR